VRYGIIVTPSPHPCMGLFLSSVDLVTSFSLPLVRSFECVCRGAGADRQPRVRRRRPLDRRQRTRPSESSLPGWRHRATTLYSVDRRRRDPRKIRTMMQPCASAARLLEGGPILSRGMKAMGGGGSPPTRIVLALHRVEASERRTCRIPVLAPVLFQQIVHIAARSLAPAGTAPLLT
jgi:hypothetical protein